MVNSNWNYVISTVSGQTRQFIATLPTPGDYMTVCSEREQPFRHKDFTYIFHIVYAIKSSVTGHSPVKLGQKCLNRWGFLSYRGDGFDLMRANYSTFRASHPHWLKGWAPTSTVGHGNCSLTKCLNKYGLLENNQTILFSCFLCFIHWTCLYSTNVRLVINDRLMSLNRSKWRLP